MNKNEAAHYLNISVNAGESCSMNIYAIILENDDGTSTNKEEVIRYYRKANDLEI